MLVFSNYNRYLPSAVDESFDSHAFNVFLFVNSSSRYRYSRFCSINYYRHNFFSVLTFSFLYLWHNSFYFFLLSHVFSPLLSLPVFNPILSFSRLSSPLFSFFLFFISSSFYPFVFDFLFSFLSTSFQSPSFRTLSFFSIFSLSSVVFLTLPRPFPPFFLVLLHFCCHRISFIMMFALLRIRILIRIHIQASWIRIRIHQSDVWIRIRILLSLSKYSMKNPNFYCFVTSFWHFIFEKWCKSTFKKWYAEIFFKISFLLASWRSMMKIEGSGSATGSISQWHWSADPDPDSH